MFKFVFGNFRGKNLNKSVPFIFWLACFSETNLQNNTLYMQQTLIRKLKINLKINIWRHEEH